MEEQSGNYVPWDELADSIWQEASKGGSEAVFRLMEEKNPIMFEWPKVCAYLLAKLIERVDGK